MKGSEARSPEEIAAAYLARAPRTEREVRARLRRAGVANARAERAVCWLQERGWLDDAGAARVYARRLLAAGHSPASAAAKLSARGVTDEVARRALAEAAEGASERDLLRAALARRTRGRAPKGPQDRLRLARWLVGRGYEEEDVRREMGMDGEGG